VVQDVADPVHRAGPAAVGSEVRQGELQPVDRIDPGLSQRVPRGCGCPGGRSRRAVGTGSPVRWAISVRRSVSGAPTNASSTEKTRPATLSAMSHPAFSSSESPALSPHRTPREGQHMTVGLSSDELLSTTRAVRHRLDLTRPVPRQLLEECVDLAVQAPTGRNRQRWHFVIVTDPGQRAALAEVWRDGLRTPGVSDPLPERDVRRADVAHMERVYSGGVGPRPRDSLQRRHAGGVHPGGVHPRHRLPPGPPHPEGAGAALGHLVKGALTRPVPDCGLLRAVGFGRRRKCRDGRR